MQVVYIGDELTATGFRLAGASPVVTSPSGAEAALHTAAASGADLILLDSELAMHVGSDALEAALVRHVPLLAVVSRVSADAAAPDLAQTVRRSLGIDA